MEHFGTMVESACRLPSTVPTSPTLRIHPDSGGQKWATSCSLHCGVNKLSILGIGIITVSNYIKILTTQFLQQPSPSLWTLVDPRHLECTRTSSNVKRRVTIGIQVLAVLQEKIAWTNWYNLPSPLYILSVGIDGIYSIFPLSHMVFAMDSI
jgi:hypothetical protein